MKPLFLLAVLAAQCMLNWSAIGEPVQSDKRKEFRSPDRNIAVTVIGESAELAEVDNFIVQVMDERNGDVRLPLPRYEEPSELGNVDCEWYWNSTVLRFLWVSETGKNSSIATYVLRKDARSGIYYFEEPALPSFKRLQDLVLTLTKENKEVFKITPASDYHFGGRSRFDVAKAAGYFVVTLATRDQYNDLLLHYAFTFHTPDWIRYDLLQIVRYAEIGSPGEPFVEPNASDALLFQKPGTPEELRWKPTYADDNSKDLTHQATGEDSPEDRGDKP